MKKIINSIIKNATILFISFFVLSSANASLLNFNLVATDSYIRTHTWNLDDDSIKNEVTSEKINPIPFEMSYIVDFTKPPENFDERNYWGRDYKGDEQRIEDPDYDELYWFRNSQFNISNFKLESPSSKTFRNLMPEYPESPSSWSYGVDGLLFSSFRVSNLTTGILNIDRSYDYFQVSYSYGFSDDNSEFHRYSLSTWINFPKTFSGIEPYRYSVDDLIELLKNGTPESVYFNESYTIDRVIGNELISIESGIFASGTHFFQVPEPKTNYLFFLLIGFMLIIKLSRNYTAIHQITPAEFFKY